MRFSIIVPVYNTAVFLEECLESILNQTFNDFELIVVNDASSDDSEAIILEYQKKDSRIKYIKHEINRGLLQARLTGAKSATGEYLWHIDSDDYISMNIALNLLNNTISQYNPDLIEFGVNTEKDWGEWFNVLTDQFISDSEQIKQLFFFSEKNASNCNKIIKTKIYQQIVIPNISEDNRIDMAEDFLAICLIMQHIKSYIGLNVNLYYYRLNSNSLAQSRWTIQKIKNNLSSKQQVLQILSKNLDKPYYEKIQFRLGSYLFNTIVELLRNNNNIDCQELYIPFMEVFGEKTYLRNLFNYDKNEIGLIWKYFQLKNTPLVENNKILGILDLDMCSGGGQRVSSILIKEFIKRGYKIILFTDEEPNSRDFDYSGAIERVILSSDMIKNIDIFQIYSDKYQIHTFITQEWLSFERLKNITILKTLNKKIIYCHHTAFLWHLNNYNTIANDIFAQTVLYDANLVLYPQAEIYWKSCNIKQTYYVPNPLTFDPTNNHQIINKSVDNIYFIGYLWEHKNPLLALKAFELALPKLNNKNIHFYIIGNGPQFTELQEYIYYNQLDKNVTLTGFVDPSSYMQKSSLQIMTSEDFEAFPMAIAEAKSYGIPTLMFELPWISFHKTAGIITIQQKDIQSLSDKIVELLNNPQQLQQLGREAFNSLEAFKTQKTIDLWEKIIQSVCENEILDITTSIDQDDYDRLIIELNKIVLKNNYSHNLSSDNSHNLSSDNSHNLSSDNSHNLSSDNSHLLNQKEYLILKILHKIKNLINKYIPIFIKVPLIKILKLSYKILKKIYRLLRKILRK